MAYNRAVARYAELDPQMLRRAAKLAQLPGVTRKQAAARFGISVGMLRRALQEHGAATRWTREDLVLHCLSAGGQRREGELGELGTLASYLDFVNKDGSSAEVARRAADDLSRALADRPDRFGRTQSR